MAAHESPYRQVPVPPELAELRLEAEGFLRDKNDEALLALRDLLRTDTEVWPHLWAPGCALAATRLGRADEAQRLLDEALRAGFVQPELFGEEFAGWPEVAERTAAVPPPSIELLDWPDPQPILPVELDRIAPEREQALRDLLPETGPHCWETATTLLRWVTTRWEHANDHVDWTDALHVLDRVDKGERFACVEYSIVLSQALNAVGIPARRIFLYSRDHHVGLGRAHVVSEAWLDDEQRWVILDGQNGAYWTTDGSVPLGLLELRQALLDDGPSPRMVGLVEDYDDATADAWRRYFVSGWTTGVGWGDGATFTPVFQGLRLIKPERLVRDPEAAYPRLCKVAIGLTGTAEKPVLTLTTPHPYARGFIVSGDVADDVRVDDQWPIVTEPGEHHLLVSVVTDYGAYLAGEVVYRVAERYSA